MKSYLNYAKFAFNSLMIREEEYYGKQETH
jgi:hypothetical protein